VRPPRVLRTETFRLAAIYTGLFAASVALLGAFVLWTARSALEQQMVGRIEAETGVLEGELRTGGLDRLIATVRGRSHSARALDYLVQSPDGTRLGGELPAVEGRAGWTNLRGGAPTPDEPDGHERLRVLVTPLPGGNLLAVGDDTTRIEEAVDAIQDGLSWAVGLTIVLGMAGGLALSATFLRRVDVIAGTAEAIMAGHLDQRVPERGTDDDLDRLARTLNRMLQRIGELIEGLRQVSSALAHDLRTPLTRLRQRLEAARTGARSRPELESAIDGGIAEMDTILATFAALLRIAEVEAGARRAGFAEVDLAAVATNVVEAFAAPAEDERKMLVSSIDPAVSVRGDRELLTQLLANLVENAIVHTPKDTRIEVRLDRTTTGGRLTVADDGPGVPAGERQRIFAKFHRLDRSRSLPGNGLGLSLVSAIADLHGARLAVNDNGPGLRVTLDFDGGARA
jgi:signal transduction histidine kinase